MKPTEHKSPLEKELIAHIRESLIKHEESYPLGAWEKFNAPEKKTRPVFWTPLLQVAAALLIIGFISFLILDKKTKTEQITKVDLDNTKPATQIDTQGRKAIVAKEHVENVKRAQANQAIEPNLPDNHKLNQLTIAPIEAQTADQQIKITNNGNINTTQQTVQVEIESPVAKPSQEVVSTNKATDPSTNIIEFLDNETKNNKIKKPENIIDNKKSKFTIGLVVAPSFGNVKRLNMGYGISIDYNLSDKFSLNSGLAYNQMAASKGVQNEMNDANAPTVSAVVNQGTTKSLESVEERVTGIDIPLEIKYHVSKNFYANIGVSAFAVINQKRNNIYIEERIVQQPNATNTFSSMLVSARVTEQEAPTKAQDYSYLGFYNLSFGYKKKISKNNSFAVEPFLKLPMREVKMENLRLIGTGVKLKFNF